MHAEWRVEIPVINKVTFLGLCLFSWALMLPKTDRPLPKFLNDPTLASRPYCDTYCSAKGLTGVQRVYRLIYRLDSAEAVPVHHPRDPVATLLADRTSPLHRVDQHDIVSYPRPIL